MGGLVEAAGSRWRAMPIGGSSLAGGPAAERRHDVAHQGGYGEDALAAWAGRVRSWRARGIAVYCYFDNGERGYAPLNALTRRRLVARADAKGSHEAAPA